MKPDTIQSLSEPQKGLMYAITCYLIWGAFPIFWYPITISPMPPTQILAQRIIWSSVFALLAIVFFKQYKTLWQAITTPKILIVFICSAAALGSNWLLYLWSISNKHLLDASLGYFMSPLFSILLGRIFFQEQLKPIQAAAIVLAASGVLWLAFLAGHIPWVAIGLTLSFGFYGLLRKIAPLDALPGLALETLCMLPFALLFLAFCYQAGQFYWADLSHFQTFILVCSGIVTTVPLLMFAAGAKRIPMSHMGIIQYISPTIQFLIGLFMFHEAFDKTRFIGYILVWAAVVLFVMGSIKRKPKQTASSS